ncbi:MAG: hypothetical protein AB8H80_21570 [Planctomycetota bacterium]
MEWSSAGIPGIDGPAWSSCEWDPDGTGPASSLIVLGGTFTVAGSTPASNLVAWNPATGEFESLGPGPDGPVYAVATSPSGELLVAGAFANAGNIAANNLARFDGTAWYSVGGGTDAEIRSMAVAANGDIFIGGYFGSAGGQTASNIARFDGNQWSGLAGGCSGLVGALLAMPNGDIVAGGQFATAGGIPTNNVARWNGTSWSSFGQGLMANASADVYALTRDANGDLIAGGNFFNAGSGSIVRNIARWDGSSWQPMGAGFPSPVVGLRTTPNGQLIASGWFQSSNGVAGIARWNGAAWIGFGTGIPGSVRIVQPLPGGDLLAFGGFTLAGSSGVRNIARWDGSSWQPIAPGFNAGVRVIKTLSNGDVVVCGEFGAAGNSIGNQVTSPLIVRWTSQGWRPLGTGIRGGTLFGPPAVRAVAELPNGDLVAGGSFTHAGGFPANNIARWDGTAWSPLGTGVSGRVFALLVLPSGDLVAAGQFQTAGGTSVDSIARWNGTNWSSIGGGVQSPLSIGAVLDLAWTPADGLIAVGPFTMAGGTAMQGIARWDGNSWAGFGSGLPFGFFSTGPSTLAVRANGNILVSGEFQMAGSQPANRLAQWNGSSWSAIGTGLDAAAEVIHELPNGDLLLGGYFTTAGGAAIAHLARWNGAQFMPVDPSPNAAVHAVASIPGALLIGGDMTLAGARVAAYLSLATSTCPAATTSLGGACPSSGGSNTLVAKELPWIGSTFEAVATGLPATCVAVAVTGVSQTSIPLSLLPQGQPGCSLRVHPDWLALQLTTASTATSFVTLPNSMALVGQAMLHQVLPVEFDASGNIVAITSTNLLSATIGAL